MRLPILFLLSLCSSGPFAFAQQVKVGVSAGLVRSFVYPQGFSTTNRYDYVHAQGHWGYLAVVYAQRSIGRKTALDASLRMVRTPATYDVVQVVPESFQVTHMWSAIRHSYHLYTGVSHTLAGPVQRQLRVFGGVLAGVERQRLQPVSSEVFSYTRGSSVAVDIQYTTRSTPVLVAGAEAGFGLRLFERADLNLRYN